MVGKTEEVYNTLKKKIISMELPPSTEITDALLVEFNVSKTPLREAILQLERDGFVKVNTRKSTVVTEITRELINQVYEVRLQVEPYIAKTYFKNIDMAEVKDIKEKFLGYNDAEDQNRDYYIGLDNRLHNLFLKACQNEFLFRLMMSVNDHNMRIREYVSHRNDDYSHAIAQHILILDSLEKGNPDAIEASVKFHIVSGKTDAYEYLDKN